MLRLVLASFFSFFFFLFFLLESAVFCCVRLCVVLFALKEGALLRAAPCRRT